MANVALRNAGNANLNFCLRASASLRFSSETFPVTSVGTEVGRSRVGFDEIVTVAYRIALHVLVDARVFERTLPLVVGALA